MLNDDGIVNLYFKTHGQILEILAQKFSKDSATAAFINRV